MERLGNINSLIYQKTIYVYGHNYVKDSVYNTWFCISSSITHPLLFTRTLWSVWAMVVLRQDSPGSRSPNSLSSFVSQCHACRPEDSPIPAVAPRFFLLHFSVYQPFNCRFALTVSPYFTRSSNIPIRLASFSLFLLLLHLLHLYPLIHHSTYLQNQ